MSPASGPGHCRGLAHESHARACDLKQITLLVLHCDTWLSFRTFAQRTMKKTMPMCQTDRSGLFWPRPRDRSSSPSLCPQTLAENPRRLFGGLPEGAGNIQPSSSQSLSKSQGRVKMVSSQSCHPATHTTWLESQCVISHITVWACCGTPASHLPLWKKNTFSSRC